MCLTCCYSHRLPFIVNTTYQVVCVQLAHFSLADWKDISIARVIMIIKSEVSTFPTVIIFFRVCVPEMLATSYSVTYCIYIPGRPEFLFSLLLRNLWWVRIVGSVLACRSYSFVCCTVHYLIVIIVQILTEDIELIKCLSDICCRVRSNMFSQLSIIQYMMLYVFNLPIPLVIIWRIHIHLVLLSSSNLKYELSSIVWGLLMKQWYSLYVSILLLNINLNTQNIETCKN